MHDHRLTQAGHIYERTGHVEHLAESLARVCLISEPVIIQGERYDLDTTGIHDSWGVDNVFHVRSRHPQMRFRYEARGVSLISMRVEWNRSHKRAYTAVKYKKRKRLAQQAYLTSVRLCSPPSKQYLTQTESNDDGYDVEAVKGPSTRQH